MFNSIDWSFVILIVISTVLVCRGWWDHRFGAILFNIFFSIGLEIFVPDHSNRIMYFATMVVAWTFVLILFYSSTIETDPVAFKLCLLNLAMYFFALIIVIGVGQFGYLVVVAISLFLANSLRLFIDQNNPSSELLIDGVVVILLGLVFALTNQ